MVSTGEFISLTTAQSLGLINRHVASHKLTSETQDLAAALKLKD
jgi:enoyl-CoA hydratase/carnithine racemase